MKETFFPNNVLIAPFIYLAILKILLPRSLIYPNSSYVAFPFLQAFQTSAIFSPRALIILLLSLQQASQPKFSHSNLKTLSVVWKTGFYAFHKITQDHMQQTTTLIFQGNLTAYHDHVNSKHVFSEQRDLEVGSQMLILCYTQTNCVVTHSSPRIIFKSLTYDL